MSNQPQSEKPPLHGLFHDETWNTPWRSPEFPLEERPSERYRRFKQKGWTSDWWSTRFFHEYVKFPDRWPWGFVIYRTAYAQVSDQEWAAAIEKLDRYTLRSISEHKTNPKSNSADINARNLDRLIREGYRNVIIDDPTLAGASISDVRKRYHEWIESHGQFVDAMHSVVRFDFCLALDDRSVRSILASVEPGETGEIGYVNAIDKTFDLESEENDEGEFYDGHFRIHLKNLLSFFIHTYKHSELELGEHGMDVPGRVVITDGYQAVTQDEDIFLVSPWSVVREDLIISEGGSKQR